LLCAWPAPVIAKSKITGATVKVNLKRRMDYLESSNWNIWNRWNDWNHHHTICAHASTMLAVFPL